MWKALSSALGESGTMDSLFKGINALPEILMKMTQTAWDGYFHLQQQWLERVRRIGQRKEAYKFEKLLTLSADVAKALGVKGVLFTCLMRRDRTWSLWQAMA